MLLLSMVLTFSCQYNRKTSVQESSVHDLPQIKDSGKLVMLTLYSSTSYFIYRGQEMGFQYELGMDLAKSLGLSLQVKIARSNQELVQLLKEGKGDFIGYNLPINRQRKKEIDFCNSTTVTHQVIVQRNRRGPNYLTDVTQLIGKDVYVKPGRYKQRLLNLNDELGGGIRIHCITNDSITQEDLISQVSHGKINYTIADNDVAQLNKTYFHNLYVKLQVSLDQRSAWAVRKETPLLKKAIDDWLQADEPINAYKRSSKRYFEQSKALPYTLFLSIRDGKISPYDSIFKKYAKTIDWDWRLLASLAFTESNFDTTVVSWVGAEGLMQLLPSTSKALGVPKGMEKNPEQSVKAACKYISITNKSLQKIADKKERINFILAAYNAGLGHVYDAMALASKYKKNPYIWNNNVAKYILLKSDPAYFTDSVCKYGYMRGIETFTFVKEIQRRYQIYQSKIKQ